MSRLPTPEEDAAWTPHGNDEPQPRRRKRKSVDMAGVGEPQSLDVREQTGRTDRANGQRFAEHWGEDFRWVEDWKSWVHWQDSRWTRDKTRRAEHCAKRKTDFIWSTVGRLLPDVGGELALELVRFAKTTASAKGIENMLKMARSEPGMAALPEQFDSHPWYWNCRNGIIDLQSRRLFPHDRALLLTKICPVEYSPTAECPLWIDTVDKILARDADLVGFFRRLCGSAMVGTILDHILAIFYGTGSNGKSLIAETLLEVFGDYGGKAMPELLLTSRGDRHPCERADLAGKRLIFCVETDEGRQLSEATSKELVGGDMMTARGMHENPWSFKPSHTLIMATNHKPRVRGTDHGLWRRLRLVPFNQRFWDSTRGESGPPDMQADRELKEKLRAEHRGILRWLVDACLEWQREGLGEPEQVRAATAQYRDAEDVIREWFDAAILPSEGSSVKASELRASYHEWAKVNNEKPVSNKRLGEYMNQQSIERSTSNGVVYHNISIMEGWKD